MKKLDLLVWTIFLLSFFWSIAVTYAESNGSIQELDSAISWAHEAWLTQFDNVNDFNPNSFLNRQQFAKFAGQFASTVLKKQTSETSSSCDSFKDINDADVTLVSAIKKACDLWLMMWYNQNFSPNALVTRWQVAIIIWRMLDKIDVYASQEDFFKLLNDSKIMNVANLWNNITRWDALLMLYRMSQKDTNNALEVTYSTVGIASFSQLLNDFNVLDSIYFPKYGNIYSITFYGNLVVGASYMEHSYKMVSWDKIYDPISVTDSSIVFDAPFWSKLKIWQEDPIDLSNLAKSNSSEKYMSYLSKMSQDTWFKANIDYCQNLKWIIFTYADCMRFKVGSYSEWISLDAFRANNIYREEHNLWSIYKYEVSSTNWKMYCLTTSISRECLIFIDDILYDITTVY